MKYTSQKLTLPTEKSKPVVDMTAFSIFIYGKQGIGKTSFTAQFPNAIHMMFEPGAKTEEIYQIHPKNWSEVEEYTQLIKLSSTYSNVVIDTIDLMFDMCCEQVCKDNGVKLLKDIGFGDGYNQAGNRFRNVLTDLHTEKGLVLLAHDKEKMKTNDRDAEYIIPSTPKRGAETVAKWVDLTAHYYLDKMSKHKLRIRTSTDREAKNRIKKRFLYTDGTPMMDIPMGNSEYEAYENFCKAFDNSFERPSIHKKEDPKTTKKLTLKK